MTKQAFPFDAGSGSSITEDQWRQMAQFWLPTGVIKGELNGMAVFADSTGMQVKVPSGRAWVKGHYFDDDTQETIAIATADPTNPRIDRVVLRADFSANTIDYAVLQGTPAASPTAPTLTQNTTSRWEMPLAQVRVDAAASTIAAAKVTDERVFSFADRLVHAVRAYSTAATDLGFVTETNVPLAGESFDTDAYHDAPNGATNYVFTIPPGLGGLYACYAQISLSGSTSYGALNYLQTNMKHFNSTGVLQVQCSNQGPGRTNMSTIGEGVTAGVSALLNLAVGDTLRLSGVIDQSGTRSPVLNGAGLTFMHALYLGGLAS